MEMILWRCPLVSAVYEDRQGPLAGWCLTELVVSSSSSWLQIEKQNNIGHTTVLVETMQIQHKDDNRTHCIRLVYLLKIFVFVCFITLIEGLCFKLDVVL